jgi:hypothetical protein
MKAMRSLPPEMRQPLSTDEPPTRIAAIEERRRDQDPRSGVSSVSVSQNAAPPPISPRSKALVIAIACGAFIIGTVAVAFTMGRQSSHTDPSAIATSPPPLQTETATQPKATAQTIAAPPVTGTVTVAAKSVDDVPVISVSSLPKTTNTVHTATAAVVQPKSDCNPNYTTDAKGRIHYKPQCL